MSREIVKSSQWKKKKKLFHNVPHTWVNNSTGAIVEVSFDADALGNVSEYRVYINDKRLKNQQEKFKTKKQALSYARRYMKKH